MLLDLFLTHNYGPITLKKYIARPVSVCLVCLSVLSVCSYIKSVSSPLVYSFTAPPPRHRKIVVVVVVVVFASTRIIIIIIMSTPQFRAGNPLAPEKGAFPLDHFGECTATKEKYLECLRVRPFF